MTNRVFTRAPEGVCSEVLIPESGTLDKTEQASPLVEVDPVAPPVDLRDEYLLLIGIPDPPLETVPRRPAPTTVMSKVTPKAIHQTLRPSRCRPRDFQPSLEQPSLVTTSSMIKAATVGVNDHMVNMT